LKFIQLISANPAALNISKLVHSKNYIKKDLRVKCFLNKVQRFPPSPKGFVATSRVLVATVRE